MARATRRSAQLVLAAALSGLWAMGAADPAGAATCTRTLVATGSWAVPANWSGNAVPTASDYVCIPAGLTAAVATNPGTVKGVSILGTLQINSGFVVTTSDAANTSPSELVGTLTGNGDLTVAAGTLTVDQGTMTGQGMTTVAAGATMAVRNSAPTNAYGVQITSRQIVNDGTITVTANADHGGTLDFYSSGSLLNNGVLDLRNGADVIGGSGLLRIGPAGTLRSSTAGEHSVSSGLEVAGRIEPTAGTLRIPTVLRPVTATTTGLLTSNGGTLVVDGSVEVPTGTQLSTGGTGVRLRGNVVGEGSFQVATGTLTVDRATMRSSTAGEHTVSSGLEVAGRIEPTAGTLRTATTVRPLAGTTTGLLTTNGGSLVLASTVEIPAGAQLSTGGTGVSLIGTLGGDGSFRVATGTLTIDQATMLGIGTTTVAQGATMALLNSAATNGQGLLLMDRHIVNDGTITVTENADGGGFLYFYSNGMLTNAGTVELRNGVDVIGSSGTIVNAAAGTITKTSGTGASDILPPVDNSGTLAVAAGLLHITNGTFPAQSGGTLTKGTYRVTAPGDLRLPGAPITVNQASIELVGAGSDLLDGSGTNALSLASSSGALTVRSGRSLATPAAFATTGTVIVGPGAGSQLQVGGAYTQSGAASTTTVDTGGTLTATGVAITGGTLRGGGTVVPGAPGFSATGASRVAPGTTGPGTLSVSGAATLASTTTLAVDVNGVGAGLADRLAVTGAATLAGTLEITTGYGPARNHDVTVVTCSTCTGTFNPVTGTAVTGPTTWKPEYLPAGTPSSVHLRAVSPLVSVADVSRVEGSTGTANLSFTITLAEAGVVNGSVTATTSNGTATTSGPGVAGQDYTAVTTVATFTPGQLTQTVNVPIRGDAVHEGNETFSLTLSAPTELTIGTGTATGTITNDDARPTISIGDLSRAEGNTDSPATLTVSLSGPAAAPITVAYVTDPGTATAPGDYSSTSGTVTFAAEVVTQTVSVAIVGDTVPEATESFEVDLSSPTGPADIADGTAVVTITNDDVRPPAITSDFDGDGRSDRAVFRPSTGRWYVDGSASVAFGTNGDIAVPAQWDADPAVDRAVFRPSNGRWYLEGVAGSVQFGTSGDLPVPGDYNGDGAIERAVFRPSTGRWYLEGTVGAVAFGTAGDIPVPGQWDADPATDMALFRPSTGRWYVHGAASVAFGTVGDVPVPGDFNGDGAVERAVFRPASGRWYVHGTAGSVVLGVNGDVPVPGQWDADAATDMAVFHPADGTWTVHGTAGAVPFGTSGDHPLALPGAVRVPSFP